jgi:hypothetical protein
MGFTSHGPLATHTYKADGPLGCDTLPSLRKALDLKCLTRRTANAEADVQDTMDHLKM